VQTVKQECVAYFVVLGEDHLRHLLTEFLRHYHQERPHQGVGNVPLSGPVEAPEGAILSPAEVRCQERLGGLLKHSTRRAA
jgi:transposase InsO family protein